MTQDAGSEAIAPGDDEIVLSKTSSSAHLSRPTLIMYYVTLVPVILWFFTDQCIESAQYVTPVIWDTVTLVTDACATVGY